MYKKAGLKGGQVKLDKNKDGVISGADFKMMKKGGKKMMGGKKTMYKKGGAKKMMGGGMPNKSFLEPATPTMFEDGGLKDLKKKQRGERKELKSKNRDTKKSNRAIVRTTRKNRRDTIKSIKNVSRGKIKDVRGKSKGSKMATAKTDPFVVRNEPTNKTTATKKTVPPTSNEKANELAGGNKTAVSKTEAENKPASKMTYSQAYRKQRDANKKAGIANYGDPKGYFTYQGKKYNTESGSEKAKRTSVVKKTKPNKPTEIKASDSKPNKVEEKKVIKKKKDNNKTGKKKGTYTGVEGGNYSVDPDTGEITETDAQKAERKRKAAEALRRRRSSYSINKGGQKVYSKIG